MSGAGSGGGTGGGSGVWLLALGQTTGYVAQTFSFAALIVALGHPVTGAGLPGAVLAAGPTAGLLLAAIAAPFSGRLLDRGKGPRLLALGPLLGALGLVVAALSAGHAALWILGFLIVGLGQATSHFETCFGYLTRELGGGARKAIVRVTLVGGFATTIAFPLAETLSQRFGWQGALLALALMQVAVTCPLNIAGTRLVARQALPQAILQGPGASALGAALRGRGFWLLAGLLALVWLNHAVLTTYSLPLLMDRGAAHEVAVMLSAALGPAQVAGRLMLVLAGARLPLRALTIWVLAGFVAASAALMIGRGIPTLWLLYALVQGASAGIASILRPVLAAEILGRERFGALWGALSVAPLLAGAAAPMMGALLLQAGGMPAVISATLVMAGGALVLGLILRPRISAG